MCDCGIVLIILTDFFCIVGHVYLLYLKLPHYRLKDFASQYCDLLGQEAISLHRDIIIIGSCVISVTSL